MASLLQFAVIGTYAFVLWAASLVFGGAPVMDSVIRQADTAAADSCLAVLRGDRPSTSSTSFRMDTAGGLYTFANVGYQVRLPPRWCTRRSASDLDAFDPLSCVSGDCSRAIGVRLLDGASATAITDAFMREAGNYETGYNVEVRAEHYLSGSRVVRGVRWYPGEAPNERDYVVLLPNGVALTVLTGGTDYEEEVILPTLDAPSESDGGSQFHSR